MQQSQTRQIVLDTETTGMNMAGGPPHIGHRIIEIGCVELINRKLTGNHYHVYINPDQMIDPDAIRVHGITDEQVRDCPRFADIAQEFADFIRGAEIIAHNASFDVGFMDHEFAMLRSNAEMTTDICSVTDSLKIAKDMYPGQKNNLDALCRRLGIDNSHRQLHGALLDAEILADVYLLMTGGQTDLQLVNEGAQNSSSGLEIRRVKFAADALSVIHATPEELESHQESMARVEKKSGALPIWQTLGVSSSNE
ncbi:DNA polymerase III subunit epsilon [Echinimonas agarilytica]|uniref:DNA polymerase III subunit epsilon n=1 Tax=Echinimonas agarilytica TaxID=1215918 RepID=A0AA42B746_9GAMM|nr:DNA polymerase III subunit epsilon [Echinimonas agarilytica]MCM2679522.1 DNA polymerase III subunit epsilon [Echinimonas agarilytica]